MSLSGQGTGDNIPQVSPSQGLTQLSAEGADASRAIIISDDAPPSPSQNRYAIVINDDDIAEPALKVLTSRELCRLSLGSIRNYIPLGTLSISPTYHICDHSHLSWEELNNPGECFGPDHPYVEEVKTLHTKGLIRMTVKTHSRCPEWITVRVYVLPGDHPRRETVEEDKRGDLRTLRSAVNVAADAWECQDDCQSFTRFQHDQEREAYSLFSFFNNLPSPEPNVSAPPNRYTRAAMEALLSQDGLVSGLQTSLYPYQRRSAALMVQREEMSERRLDCRLVEVTAPDNSRYYYERRTGRFLSEHRDYETCRGGILAETMGLGKTLICLAVIMATKYHWPQVPAKYALQTRPKIGTLADMASAAIQRYQIPWRQFFDAWDQDQGVEYPACIKKILENTDSYMVSPPESSRSTRRPQEGRKVRLSPGTIVVCPPNLLQQWRSEIAKHTAPDSLKILVMENRNVELPPIDELVTYDVILFTRFRFDHERSVDRYHNGRSYHSPLVDIHWKRIIFDEGNHLSHSTSNSSWTMKGLRVERRWMVSGTPARNLIGVEAELATMQTTSESPAIVDEDAIDEALRLGTLEPSMREDACDMKKLGDIVTRFLNLHPSTTEGNPFDRIAQRSGYRGLDPELEQPLEEIFIKHRPEDVDKDIQLPPLHHRVVRLEPCFFDKLSLNLFSVQLAVNAVTSERIGEHYMFHPFNRQELSTLVSNIRQSGFFWCGFSAAQIRFSLDIGQKYLIEKATTCPPEDQQLLREAIRHSKLALASPNWEAFGFYQELGCFVENFPQEDQHAWAIQSMELDPLCIGLTMLGAAQSHVNSRLCTVDPSWGLHGAGLMAMALARKKLQERRGQVKRQLTDKKKSFDKFSANQAKMLKRPWAGAKDLLPPESTLTQTRLIGTASRKLSYLLDEILKYHKEEKILCFYEHDYIAYNLAQALEICDVKYLIYGKGLDNLRKARYLVTFNTTEKFRVMIMNVTQAAFGLNLCSASRIYFVNPVWERNVEVQAIKRAHRIGQTKPVYVETLVLRDTIEEKMLERRKQMTREEQYYATEHPLVDKTIADVVKKSEFLSVSDEERSGYGQIARLTRPVQIFGLPSRVDEDPDADLVVIDPSRPRKRLRTRRVTRSPADLLQQAGNSMDPNAVMEDQDDEEGLVDPDTVMGDGAGEEADKGDRNEDGQQESQHFNAQGHTSIFGGGEQA